MTFKIYSCLVVFRIANVFLIQSQFDPDEYWQNLEPAYCHVFGNNDPASSSSQSSCPGLTWEWKQRRSQQDMVIASNNGEHWSRPFKDLFLLGLESPVRSYASILPTLIFYAIIKKYRLDSSWMVSRGPVFVNAICVAALTDYTVWYMSRWMRPTRKMEHHQQKKQQHSNDCNDTTFWCIYCSVTSWFNAYALIRTYSNSIETAIFSLSLALVSPLLLPTNQTPKYSSTMTTVRAWIAFFIGGICVSIRFSSLTAYIPMGIILAWDNDKNKTIKAALLYLFGICALPGFLGFASTLLLDKAMYGFWAIPVLGNFHFNVIQGNGSLYGTHPFHWYVTSGIPALTGLLLPVLIYDGLATWDRARRNLWTIVVSYVVIHSLSEHKEFRFLLPILPIFCLICGARIQNMTIGFKPSHIKQVIILFAAINLIPILYLGLFHQRAPIDINRAIINAVTAQRSKYENHVEPPVDIQVHYLMGCHSTPLLSHLHYPRTKFLPWFLDCSPTCRASLTVNCESDDFAKDPGGFMKKAYNLECSEIDVHGICAVDGDSNLIRNRSIPDYIVSNSNDLSEMRAQLELLGMKEIGRFIMGVNGVKVGAILTVGAESFINTSFTKVGFFNDSFTVSLEEMILFQKTYL